MDDQSSNTQDKLIVKETTPKSESSPMESSIDVGVAERTVTAESPLLSPRPPKSIFQRVFCVPFWKLSLARRIFGSCAARGGRLNRARSAFRSRDMDASMKAHESPAEPHGGVGSDYIKSIVFGALDGILTTFAIITAAQGGYGDNQKAISNTILVLGFANNIADAFSMGFGEYVSASAEIDHIRAERKREEWEVDTNIEGEKKEMIDIYVKKGLSEADAQTVVDVISKDKKVFVDIMMAEELELLSSAAEDGASGKPMRQGIVIFVSFFIFGSIPLLAYITGRADNRTFGLACALVGVSLFSLGSIKGRLTNMSMIYAGTVMLFTGCVVAAISYAIGALCSRIFQINEEL